MSKMTCPKCDGKGKIPGFSHIHNGDCFACGGTGYLTDRSQGKVQAMHWLSEGCQAWQFIQWKGAGQMTVQRLRNIPRAHGGKPTDVYEVTGQYQWTIAEARRWYRKCLADGCQVVAQLELA